MGPTATIATTLHRPADTQRVCRHCASALHADQAGPYCCLGCQAVHLAIEGAGLDRYYDLRGPDGVPVGDLGRNRSLGWLAPLERSVAQPTAAADASAPGVDGAGRADGAVVLRLRVQGIHCAACVWLIEQLFERADGGVRCDINPGSGALTLTVRPGFALAAFVRQVEGFGYLLGPLVAEPELDLARRRREGLLLRATLASVCAGNAMVFAAAIYLGLHEGPLFRLLHGLNFACATLAVMVGGPVFISSAVRALRLGLLHLDLPIAVGIVGSFLAASWSYITGHTGAAYYDSLAVFVALMLWGRYLQDRLVDWNRDRLLSAPGTEALTARRVDARGVQEVPIADIRTGDRLVLPVGDMLLVSATLDQARATCALDSIDGEPLPRAFGRGDSVPAGAVNEGLQPLQLVASETFATSAAQALLGSPTAASSRTPTADRASTTFSAAYVGAVLGFAALALAVSRLRGLDWSEALSAATAVCVVTCPCSIGIALPLARETIYRKLQRLGLFVRTSDFLARAAQVRRIAFDKTGTLTDGVLHVADAAPLARLARVDRAALLAMVSVSRHPRSEAIHRALRKQLTGPTALDQLDLREVPGAGLEARIGDHRYRLGSTAFTAQPSDTGCVHFTRDDQSLATIVLRERLRPAAASELARLREHGYDLFVLSGDSQARVDNTALRLGLDPERALGRMEPEAKRRWIEQQGAGGTLMLGDGINDSLALEAACCSGTPAVSRSSVCARADFYYTSAGLGPVTAALRAARDLRRITHRNWAFLALYNTVTVAAAVSGLMEPLVAAIVMPLSSTASIATTTLTLNRWSAAWRS